MREKYQSKYLSQEKSTRKKTGGLVAALVVVLIAVVSAVLFFRSPKESGSSQNPTEPVREVASDGMKTDGRTVSDTLQFQVEEMEGIRYEEISENGVIADVFYMVQEDYEWELFRICYGDAATGTVIGRMQINGWEVPVKVMTSAYTEINFPDRETYDRYYSSMDYLNAVLESLSDVSTFTASEGTAEMAKQTADLVFWSIELPVNIEWEERTANQSYTADFYGILGGERILLYTVSLGGQDVKNAIGMYAIDGGKTPVSVKTHSLETQSVWLGDAYSAEYAVMMETINDVIRVITADQDFIDQMP